MKKKILVTGAAGFIGSHVARECELLGFDVTGVDDLSGGFMDNVPPGIRFIQGSVADPAFVKDLWRNNKFDYVYHLAAYAAEGLSHFIRRHNYQVNLIASVNLINEAVLNGVESFVFTSSIAVYGPGQTPMTEEMIPRPEDPYGISKYAVELDLEAAHRMFGLNYVIFRPHNVYGEHQNIADKYRNVIGIFMNQVMQGKAMTIFGDGSQTRAFSHVADVAPIIAKSPLVDAATCKTFNIGADEPYSVLHLAQEIAAAFKVEPTVQFLPARQEVVHAYASHDLVREVFSPRAPVALREGIEKMADWVRRRGPMQTVDFKNIEVVKNLPPSWDRSMG
jgi:UDP-glucose 4-epimerase